MGRVHDAIDGRLAEFLERQPVFFVATAPLAAGGLVNVSPKGLAGTFAVVDERTVAYLDLTGSGVETIAHLRENGRIVVMVCSFEGPPRIVRLHGTGTVHLPASPRFEALRGRFGDLAGVRSVIEVAVARISDSCGYGVPLMEFKGHREQLVESAERKGEDGLDAYRAEHNAVSLDGLPGLTAGSAPAP